MKSLACLTLGLAPLAATCLLFQGAQATPLFSEGFNYATGGLGSKVNPGSGIAWTGNNNITVVNNNLTYSDGNGTQLADLGGNALQVVWGVSSGTALNSPAFGTAVSSGQIYYSFLLDMTVLPAGSSSYLTALNKAGTSPGGSGDNIDIYINSSGLLQIRSKGAYSSSSLSPTLSLNTTYMVVLGLDYTSGAQTASLWLNPILDGNQPSAYVSVTPGGALDPTQDVGIKAQTSSTAGTFLMDDLRIGTTWADVTPVPEPGTLSLAGLALLGFVLARRDRR